MSCEGTLVSQVLGFESRDSYLVLADHDLLDQVTSTDLDLVGLVKCRGDFTTRNKCQSFDTLKVGMLDGHDTLFRKDGFRVVVDQLSVDETCDTVGGDLFNLGLHFFL